MKKLLFIYTVLALSLLGESNNSASADINLKLSFKSDAGIEISGLDGNGSLNIAHGVLPSVENSSTKTIDSDIDVVESKIIEVGLTKHSATSPILRSNQGSTISFTLTNKGDSSDYNNLIKISEEEENLGGKIKIPHILRIKASDASGTKTTIAEIKDETNSSTGNYTFSESKPVEIEIESILPQSGYANKEAGIYSNKFDLALTIITE